MAFASTRQHVHAPLNREAAYALLSQHGPLIGLGWRDIHEKAPLLANDIAGTIHGCCQIAGNALRQCASPDPSAVHAVAGILGLSDGDAARHFADVQARLAGMSDFLHSLLHAPDMLALTRMDDPECSAYITHFGVLNVNAGTFFKLSRAVQTKILIHASTHAGAGADDFITLPNMPPESRFADDYAETAHLLFSDKDFIGTLSRPEKVGIREAPFVCAMHADNVAHAIRRFKADPAARVALLLHNADTLTLLARVLSEIQDQREATGAHLPLRPRHAEGIAQFYRLAARREHLAR